MNIKKKLENPFVLMAQGFVAGAVLFWSAQPAEVETPRPGPSAQTVAAAQTIDI